MSTSYLLDTSVLILVLKQDGAILKRMEKIQPVYISSSALGELYYGAEHSSYAERSLSEVNELAKTATILATDKATAEIYGHLKHEQRMKGLMIPDNDLWIASQQFSIALPWSPVIVTLCGLTDLLWNNGNLSGT